MIIITIPLWLLCLAAYLAVGQIFVTAAVHGTRVRISPLGWAWGVVAWLPLLIVATGQYLARRGWR